MAEIGVVALIGLVFALIGPFGTDALPLAGRFAYWIGGFLIGGVLFRLITRLTLAVTELLGWPGYIAYALAVPLLAVPIMMAVTLGTGGGGSLMLYAQIVAVGAGFFLIFAWIYGRKNASSSGGDEPAEPTDVPQPQAGILDSELHADLPPAFGAIAALAVEDHYVTVHGADGSREMLLVNLADAIRKVGAENGLQTHRSWWVAEGAVNGSKRDGRNQRLMLASGLEVPLSRANVAKARERGWL